MFFLKKKKTLTLYAPITGKNVSLESVPDPAFSQKLIGEGVAIEPYQGVMVAPCDATVTHIIDSKHSCVLTHEESNVEILIHIGVNTVQLNGSAFIQHVKMGQKVERGQTLLEFDMEQIREGGFPLITPVVLSNPDPIHLWTPNYGEVVRGQDKILDIVLT